MTVLYDPGRRIVFSDEPCATLAFATADAVDIIDGPVVETLVSGLTALHHRDDGMCVEDGHDWPCKTVQLARIARGVQ